MKLNQCCTCRQEKKRDGCCCCCIRLPENYSESTCGKRDLLQEFMDKFFAPVILSLPGKVIVQTRLRSMNQSFFGRLFFRIILKKLRVDLNILLAWLANQMRTV